ncbi:hypothetical protein KR054_001355 [Drosophila jambulina]|nr:hypothetical protein KR054_001355 [Drosophila jambulina]
MFRFTLVIFILIALCITYNQVVASASSFLRSADISIEPETPADSVTSTDSDKDKRYTTISEPVKDIKKGRKKKARSVRNRYQKTFLRNPNYKSANKLFEKESNRSNRMRKQYPLPHPGFQADKKEEK